MDNATGGSILTNRDQPNDTNEEQQEEPSTTPSSNEHHHHNRPRRQKPCWKYTLELLASECQESENPYLVQFAASPLAQIFLTNDIVGDSIGHRSRSELRKELAEVAALEAQLAKKLPELHEPSNNNNTNDIVIWDLCSGKGFSAMWLSVNTFAGREQHVHIHMVDKNTKANRDYLAAFSNLSFHAWNLYGKELEDAIRQSNSNKNNTTVVLVGIHLCGDLARRALELHRTCQTHAILLSPCCAMKQVAPKKRRLLQQTQGRFGYDVPRIARRLQQPVYDIWCWMLWGHARSTTATAPVCPSTTNVSGNDDDQDQHYQSSKSTLVGSRIDLQRDDLMKTDKNYWLTVVHNEHARSTID